MIFFFFHLMSLLGGLGGKRLTAKVSEAESILMIVQLSSASSMCEPGVPMYMQPYHDCPHWCEGEVIEIRGKMIKCASTRYFQESGLYRNMVLLLSNIQMIGLTERMQGMVRTPSIN